MNLPIHWSMLPLREKILFGYLGALTAIVVALSMLNDPLRDQNREPASSTEIEIESLYFFYFD